ncbi:HAD-IA family hydrolase [Alkalibaculum sp. M08DMB]|uniref:HAD-IA family hydrolase n=1 Tax=Alkalibaculum sporogenes TaxID=2655001 RepID=A0A6A7KCP0_9FIRM|nr:HAD family hydrolase [Alkalibaculum sporogenes]MPW26773.1 HAD-IA family hydrolase [Alkalibaculum sporogenes]
MISNVNTIFFDFDGTLHDSITVYVPAFNKAYNYLVQNNLAKERVWKESEICHWLGFNKVDMWKKFAPNLDEDVIEKVSKLIGDEMAFQIRSGYGYLYEGCSSILNYLKNKNYTLVFLSNCGSYYKNLVKEHYHLDLYFTDMFCSEEFNQIPKYEILRQLKSRYLDEMVIIGDRFHDIEAGTKNNIHTIGCEYGYCQNGELNNSDRIIKNINELYTIL